MERRTLTVQLPLFLFAVVFSEQGGAVQPKVFYVELVGSSDSLQIASFNYAIEKANANTSNQGQKSFTLELANSSRHEDLFHHATALLQRHVAALIEGGDSYDSACLLGTFTQIPLVRHHGNHEDWDECEALGVSLSANHASYSRVTAKLLKTFYWTEVVIVYEESFTRVAHNFKAFIDRQTTEVNLLKIYKLTNETSKDSITRTIKMLSTLSARVVLLQTSERYQRMLLAEIPVNFTVQPHDMIVGFRLPRERAKTWQDYETRLQSNANGAKVDLTSLKDDVVLQHDAGRVLAQALADMSKASDWVRTVNGTSQYAPLTNRMLMLEHLKKVRMQGITGRIQFDKNGLRDAPDLDVINLQNDLPIKVGSWSLGKLALTKDLAPNRVTQNKAPKLEGKRLKVVTVPASPFVVKVPGSGNSTKYEGACIDILEELASQLKFTYDIGLSSDGKYGAETNGVWNGMIGDLVRKEADMAVAGLTVTRERESVVDFTVAYMPTTVDMVLKKTMVEEIDFLQFMMPLQIPVWIMIIVCQLVVTAAIYTLNYYSPYGYKDEEGKGTSPEFNLFNSLWFSLACMLQQGGDNTPKATSGRLLAGCYWFCILVVVSTYTANLAAFLTTKNEHLPVNNLEEAFEAGYEIAVTGSSSTSAFFQNSKSEFHQNIWKKMDSENSFAESGGDGISKARQREKFVYLSDGPYLEYQVGQEPCDLVALPALTKDESLGIALQASSPHVHNINLAMLRMRQVGFFEQVRRRWWFAADKCTKPQSVVSGKQVDLKMMAGVYIVLVTGFLIAFAVLGAEILWYKRKRDKLKSEKDKQSEVAYEMPVVAN